MLCLPITSLLRYSVLKPARMTHSRDDDDDDDDE